MKLHIDPVDGLTEAAAREAVDAAKLNPAAIDGAADILVKLYRCFVDGDCDLAEINPLILTPEGKVHALDAKVSLDDNAAFRHPEWDEFEAPRCSTSASSWPSEKGLQYIGLEGTVGIIANGAGLAMSTLDVVNQVGRQAANFLDIGGGANADVMAAALEVINTDAEREGDPHQHLRRHHPRRGGGQGHRRGARPGEARGADRHPPRRHQRRGGPCRSWPTPASPTTLISQPTMLEAARTAVAIANGAK